MSGPFFFPFYFIPDRASCIIARLMSFVLEETMNHRQSFRQKQELERTALVALGLVSERYAGVSKIDFLMT
jgi:hypothetical protein